MSRDPSLPGTCAARLSVPQSQRPGLLTADSPLSVATPLLPPSSPRVMCCTGTPGLDRRSACVFGEQAPHYLSITHTERQEHHTSPRIASLSTATSAFRFSHGLQKLRVVTAVLVRLSSCLLHTELGRLNRTPLICIDVPSMSPVFSRDICVSFAGPSFHLCCFPSLWAGATPCSGTCCSPAVTFLHPLFLFP